MGLIDWIILGVIAGILGFAGWYVWQAKKKGAACIGCPDSGTCSGQCQGCKGCGCPK